MDSSLDSGSPIEVVTPRNGSSGATASAYPSKEVMLSRRRRELLVPFACFLASSASALMSSKVSFGPGIIVGIVAAVLCLYQCYRVLKAREAPPRPPQSPARARCRRAASFLWQLALIAVTTWSCMIGIVRVASFFEANLLEKGVCNWGCVRVSLFRSENCDGFCNPLLLRTDQASIHAVVRRWLAEQPHTSIVKTVEKDKPKSKNDGGQDSLEEGPGDLPPKEREEGGQPPKKPEEQQKGQEGGADTHTPNEPPFPSPIPAAEPAVTPPSSMYTYGLSLSTLIGFPSELGVETSCMPLPAASGNTTGVLVSVQAQQLFRVGFPDIEGEKVKVKELLQVLRDAADGGLLPDLPCS